MRERQLRQRRTRRCKGLRTRAVPQLVCLPVRSIGVGELHQDPWPPGARGQPDRMVSTPTEMLPYAENLRHWRPPEQRLVSTPQLPGSGSSMWCSEPSTTPWAASDHLTVTTTTQRSRRRTLIWGTPPPYVGPPPASSSGTA